MADSPYEKTSPVRKALAMVAEDRREFAALLVYSFLQSVLFLAVPLVAQALVNVVVSGLYLQPLIVLTIALLVGLLAGGVLTIIRFYLVEVMRERIFARVALRVAEKLPKVHHRTLNEKNGPELMNRFFDVVNIQKSWSKLAFDGPGAMLDIFVGLVLLGIYGTELFGVAVASLLVGLFFMFVAGYGGLTTSLKESTEKYRVAEWLEEMVRCQDSIKVNSRPSFWAEEADERVVRFLTERRRHFWILVRQKTFAFLLSAIAFSGTLGMGGYLVMQGDLTLGQLVAAELVIWGILKATEKMIGLTESFFDLLTALEKVSKITGMKTDVPGSTIIPMLDNGAKVDIMELYFSYSPESPPLFADFTLNIAPGEMITILGPAACGKSTLVGLLAGFLEPNKGSLELDDVDLRELHPESKAENIAVFSNKADLFAGNLVHNIGTGRAMGLHQVKELLDFSGGRRLLRQLPKGAESHLSCGGLTLSGSEKASVLLTRSLVGKPRLLMLDETLYNLSEDQQRTMASNLHKFKGRCTILSTVALPDLVAESDRIIYLTGPSTYEEMTAKELAKRSGDEWTMKNLSVAVGAILKRESGGKS